jgi:hypothetical protein
MDQHQGGPAITVYTSTPRYEGRKGVMDGGREGPVGEKERERKQTRK